MLGSPGFCIKDVRDLKKLYQKPTLICDEIHPETMLCACDWKNTSMNEEWHCAFDPDGLGFTLFMEGWGDCMDTTGKFGKLQVCVYTAEVHVFGS